VIVCQNTVGIIANLNAMIVPDMEFIREASVIVKEGTGEIDVSLCALIDARIMESAGKECVHVREDGWGKIVVLIEDVVACVMREESVMIEESVNAILDIWGKDVRLRCVRGTVLYYQFLMSYIVLKEITFLHILLENRFHIFSTLSYQKYNTQQVSVILLHQDVSVIQATQAPAVTRNFYLDSFPASKTAQITVSAK
jgi:hypothetical protein